MNWRDFFQPALRRKWLLLTVAAAVAMRLLFVFRWSISTPDTEIYADIAKTWLQTGVYGIGGPDGPEATLMRLPGYPAFLAAIFAVAGIDHYNAVRFVQVVIDILTALVVADTARRVVSRRAGAAAFVIYALCPFVANYVAVPLTETLAIFATALAFWCAVIGCDSPRLRPWIACGVATAYGILLRPDGGIVLIAIGLYLAWRAARSGEWKHAMRAALVLGVVSLAPLVPWTIRNWRTLHVFQPLVPLAANAPDEFVAHGFDRWQRTWVIDYADLVDAGFKIDSEALDPGDLPARALGTDDERRREIELLAAYNRTHRMTAPVDAGFAAIAAERIARAPVRYYVLLPAARAADLWLRPRTEILPVDAHWWDIDQGWDDFTVSIGLGVLNLLLCAAAVAGLCIARIRYVGLLAGFCALRTLIITALQLPEPRYTLECFPAVIVFAGAAYDAWRARRGERAPRKALAAVMERD